MQTTCLQLPLDCKRWTQFQLELPNDLYKIEDKSSSKICSQIFRKCSTEGWKSFLPGFQNGSFVGCQSWGPTGGRSPAVLLCLAIHTPRLKHYSFPKRSMIGQPPSPPSQIHKGNNRIQKSVRPTVLYLAAQSCLTLCGPMDYSPPGFSVHRDSPGKNTGVGCHALLQGIFPNQGSNPGFPR